MTAAIQQQQLLDYLLARGGGDSGLCRSAREHMLCRALFNGIGEMQRGDGPLADQMQLLASCREAAAQECAASSAPAPLSSGWSPRLVWLEVI